MSEPTKKPITTKRVVTRIIITFVTIFCYVVGFVLVIGAIYPSTQRYLFFWPVPILLATYVSVYVIWQRLIEMLEESQGTFQGRKSWKRI